MSAPDLADLVARVEAAEGPSRELDREIADAMGWVTLSAYTASLDAAMTLVPEGWSVGIGHLPGRDWIVRAHLRDHRPESLTKDGHSHIWREGHSKHFALALVAAALRTRKQKEQTDAR